MRPHKTIINDAVSMCDFMLGLNANELTTLWNGVFPGISMAQDKTAAIKRMVCRILERKYTMSGEKNKQMLNNQGA